MKKGKVVIKTEEKIIVGMEDGSAVEVLPSDVSFSPEIGEEVYVFESQNVVYISPIESKTNMPTEGSGESGKNNFSVSKENETDQEEFKKRVIVSAWSKGKPAIYLTIALVFYVVCIFIMYFATMGKIDSKSYTFFKMMDKVADMLREDDMSFIAAIGFTPVVYQIAYFASVIGLAAQFIIRIKIKTKKTFLWSSLIVGLGSAYVSLCGTVPVVAGIIFSDFKVFVFGLIYVILMWVGWQLYMQANNKCVGFLQGKIKPDKLFTKKNIPIEVAEYVKKLEENEVTIKDIM